MLREIAGKRGQETAKSGTRDGGNGKRMSLTSILIDNKGSYRLPIAATVAKMYCFNAKSDSQWQLIHNLREIRLITK